MLPVIDLRDGAVFARPQTAADPRFRREARAILDRVRAQGDAALIALALQLDGATLASLQVSADEIAAAAERVPPELRSAIDAAAARLRDLAAEQLPREWSRTDGGVAFGEVVRPLHRVGCYVPGGRASYPSTVLMTAVPARAAGVEEVVICTPPSQSGAVPDAVLYACSAARVDQVFLVGGAQAVAALAYGTETIPRVDKIVGPGNAWVTAAKAEVASEAAVGIDGLAGPTELVLVAEATADPQVVAADLIAQAEHDPLAEAYLVGWDESLPAAVSALLDAAAEGASRAEILRSSLPNARAILVRDQEQAAQVVDQIAPEHLQIATDDPAGFLKRVRSFGAAFLGPHTPVSLGDYGVGSNHVLPTFGTARFASGLRASDFVTVSSVVEASAEGLAAAGGEVALLARAEGLEGHARAVEVRRP
ncbi:MAG: histidinol dehydrogenase [Actinobacteria bacterium]|nr:histidinol dehydrogenase [Actinomycetota bacterium]